MRNSCSFTVASVPVISKPVLYVVSTMEHICTIFIFLKIKIKSEIKDNERLQLFLDARNPGKNPRLTLDSLLGKLILVRT